MSRVGPLVLAGALAALALAGCNQKDGDAAPGVTPPRTAALAAPGPVAPGDLPRPSPGFWETKMVAGAAQDAAFTSRTCYDAAFAKEASMMGQEMAQEGCTQSADRQLDGSIKIASACTGPDGVVRRTEGVVRGDFTKAYAVEIVTVGDAATGAPGGGTMTMEAERLGDCPADFKPGDIEINGMRMNMAAVREPPPVPPQGAPPAPGAAPAAPSAKVAP